MNRFLTRKKDRVLDDGSSSGKKSKKGKKNQPEPKVEVNLATALPSTDDFRTSLIMPTLSTRFSMLREQDDPNSKLGKASDDSVLHPKRQSRLHEFGFMKSGLDDIAEVSSIHDPIRPFAKERQGSFDSYNTEEGSGSIMNRSRPGEGNVLFGGRQKIYKIPNSGSSKSLGRALYDDDVSTSTFQKFRLQEKGAKKSLELQDSEPLERSENTEHSEPSSPTRDLTYLPALSAFNQRRETSSSTNSGSASANTRSSTAATSIASQGANSVSGSSSAPQSSNTATSPTTELNRTTTKARRLYDHGLDQHINEQQSSTLNRLNSIQRNIGPTGRSTPPLMFARSATNLSDRFNRNGPHRTESPTPMPPSPGFSKPQSPPMSPLASDSEEAQTLKSALQPNDRGKATAMGAFNKPKMAFSEQQYAERLKRLHQEREAAVPVLEKPHKPSLRERAELEQRKRAEAAERKKQNPVEEPAAPSPFSVFQSAASQMKAKVASPTIPPAAQADKSSENTHVNEQGGTFFSSADSSDDEDVSMDRIVRPADLDERLKNIPIASQPTNRDPPSILEHPALRSRSSSRHRGESSAGDAATDNDQPPLPLSEKPQVVTVETEVRDPDIDSPTLGPDNGGLSGLVRQHLRNVSNVSSDYGEPASSPPPPPAPLSLRTQELGFQRRQQVRAPDDTSQSSNSYSNPWDLEDLDNSVRGEADSMTSTSPMDRHKPKMQNYSATSTDPITRPWDRNASQDDGRSQSPVEVRKTRQRTNSTETQDDREAFQRELAQRQRAIQESLRSKVSAEHSRSASPAPSNAPSASGLKSALTMLRSKSSRDSFATNDLPKNHPPKAMQMLGLGSSANNSTTSLSGASITQSHEDDRRPLRSKPSRILQQSEEDARRELEQRLQRSATEGYPRDLKSAKGRSPPASSSSSTRNRSSSELSNGRSHSRPGRYRDDLDKAMAEGTSSSSVYPANSSPSLVQGFVANPTPPLVDTPSSNGDQGRLRSRSNSRTNGNGYFEPKTHLQIHTGHSALNGSNSRLSPAANGQKPSFSPGLPVSPRPSPGAPSPSLNVFRAQPSPVPPFSANATPPISASSTPVVSTFSAANPTATKLGVRKKSIVKSEISEPMFISATSVMDTVDLPPGASLKNGMEAPPPLPPINPMRRRFGFGRSDHHDTVVQPPQPPFAEPLRTNSSEELSKLPSQTRQRLRKTSSEGKSLHAKAQVHTGPSPALPSSGFVPRNNSPPRPARPSVAEGAMF